MIRIDINSKYIKILAIILISWIISLYGTSLAYGSSDFDGAIDYDDIQDSIDNIMDSNEAMNFGDYVQRLIKGQESFSITAIGSKLLAQVRGELKANISTFGQIIAISLIAAIFTNLSMAFKFNQVSETGYYVTYILLFGLLITSFIGASNIAAKVISQLLDFMKAL